MERNINTRAINFINPNDVISVNQKGYEREAIELGIWLWNAQQLHYTII